MKNRAVNILFTGDFCPHNRIEKLAMSGDYKRVFNDFTKEFKNNDLNVVDLECPLTESNKGIEKTGPHQKAHPKTINLLNEINIGMVAMANNHILDYGEKALLDTINLCEKNNITTFGAGKNIEYARKPAIKEINGIKIGFLNFAEKEWTIAKRQNAGANPVNLIDNFNDIQSLKKKVDKVIVVAHGNNEFYHLPSPRIKKTYRFYIDSGAHAVISHHTHCLSGYEVYKKAPIFYGLGNFVYDWPGKKDDNWNFGYVVRLKIKGQIQFEVIPFKQNNGEEIGVNYLNDIEKENFTNKMEVLNNLIGDDKLLNEEFSKLCSKNHGIYSLYFEPYRGKLLNALRIRKILPDLFTKKKRMLQLNVLRCQSHRDILINSIERAVKNK